MKEHKKLPIVSVGLPTYNRPAGLARALDQLLQQTYPALEIIVSDNCSNQKYDIEGLVSRYQQGDSRIIFFRQPINKGAFFNFQFVLEKASGEYFMWFADDDNKAPIFIEKSLEIMKGAGGAFGTYAVQNYFTNTTYVHTVPIILQDMPLPKQLFRFITIFPSVYIYGLFRKKSLDFFLAQKESFDFSDGYLAMHVLLKDGLNVTPTEIPITILGIEEKEYVFKPVKKESNRTFRYGLVIRGCTKLIREEERLSFFWKNVILIYFMLVMLRQFITYEHKHNAIAWVLNYLVRLPLRYLYRLSISK